jgi:hypothetical protein
MVKRRVSGQTTDETYTAPRNPWNNGEVERFNSIFATKFWNRTRFNNEDEIDVEIKKFNFEREEDILLKDSEEEGRERGKERKGIYKHIRAGYFAGQELYNLIYLQHNRLR